MCFDVLDNKNMSLMLIYLYFLYEVSATLIKYNKYGVCIRCFNYILCPVAWLINFLFDLMDEDCHI